MTLFSRESRSSCTRRTSFSTRRSDKRDGRIAGRGDVNGMKTQMKTTTRVGTLLSAHLISQTISILMMISMRGLKRTSSLEDRGFSTITFCKKDASAKVSTMMINNCVYPIPLTTKISWISKGPLHKQQQEEIGKMVSVTKRRSLGRISQASWSTRRNFVSKAVLTVRKMIW